MTFEAKEQESEKKAEIEIQSIRETSSSRY